MRILMNLTGDETKASSRVRGYWIAKELEHRGHSVKIVRTERATDYPKFWIDIGQHDATIVQKKYGRYDLISARIARLLGKPLFLDIDDAPSRIQSPKTEQNARIMMRLSRSVLAGCKNLSELAHEAGASAHFIPTGVRCENYPIKKHEPRDLVTLGWVGNGPHYADDLVNILVEPLEQLAHQQKLRFRLIGAGGEQKLYSAFGAINNLEIDFIDTLNWADPTDLAKAMSPVDIGLYPLGKNHFNRFKCAFKALEYMACGIPVVASSVGANAETVLHNETGFLCSNSSDWTTHISTLLNDHDLRQSFGTCGRAVALKEFDISKVAEKVEAALTSAI